MLISVPENGTTKIFLDKFPGQLAIELDSPMFKSDMEPSISYYGTSIYSRSPSVQLVLTHQPTDGEYFPYWTFILSPPVAAKEDQVLRHTYLISKPGGTEIKHMQHIVLVLTESGPSSDNPSRSWALSMDGLGAMVIMPPDFMTCEDVHGS